jgi:hypothetical protein
MGPVPFTFQRTAPARDSDERKRDPNCGKTRDVIDAQREEAIGRIVSGDEGVNLSSSGAV